MSLKSHIYEAQVKKDQKAVDKLNRRLRQAIKAKEAKS